MKFIKESLLKQAIMGIIIILIPIIIAFVLVYHQSKAHSKQSVLDGLTVIAEAYEGQIHLFLDTLKRRAEDFASDGFIKNQLLRKTRGTAFIGAGNLLNKHLSENKLTLCRSIKNIDVVSLDGIVIASTNSSEIGKDLSREAFFIKGINATTISENHIRQGDLPELIISTPILSRSIKEPIGALVNHVHISDINKILSIEYTNKLRGIPQGREVAWKTLDIYLVNKDKRIIAKSGYEKNAILRQSADILPVETALTTGKEVTELYRNYCGMEVFGISATIPSMNWALMVEIDKYEVFASAKVMRINALITGVIVVGMIITMFIVFIKKVVKPLRLISSAAQRISSGDLNVAISCQPGNEIGMLCKIFNTMAGDIKNRMYLQLRLTALLEATPDLVGIADMDGKTLYLNLAARKMLGTKVNEVSTGITITGAHSQWAAALFSRERVSDAITNGIWCGEAVFLTQDGINIAVSQVIIAHKNPEGEVKYLSTIARDITGRRLMEDAMRKSENKYKTLLENLPQKIFYKDRNSVYVSCNENYARDLKIHADEIEGKTDYDFYPAELAEKYRANDKRIIESGKSEELEEIYLIDGVETIVRTIKTPIKDNKSNISGILGIFWDITEHKRAEEEQKRLKEQLYYMHQLESISTLAGGVAHDFNNIFALVMGYGSLLEKEMGKDDPLRTYVQKILDSAERAANLTSGLLTFSRKQQTANFKPVHVNETVRKTERFLLQLIGKEIRIKTVLTNKDCVVLGNSNQIEQVLVNLATNAKDAMPGGGSLVIRTDVVALDGEQIIKYDHCEAGMYACISVSDTGVGMDNNTKARIFEPFFTTKEVGKGTGIGLSIVHGIVKQHKGFVDVYSKLHEGTTFKIYLPITETRIEERKSEDVFHPVCDTEAT